MPIAAQQSSKPRTLLFPTKPYWLVSRVPKHKRGGSQKLRQVLVTARLLGNTALIYTHTKCCGSWLHLKMRYCSVPPKLSTEKGDRNGWGMWHLLEKKHLWGQWEGQEVENKVHQDITAHDISYFLSSVEQRLQTCLIPALRSSGCLTHVLPTGHLCSPSEHTFPENYFQLNKKKSSC